MESRKICGSQQRIFREAREARGRGGDEGRERERKGTEGMRGEVGEEKKYRGGGKEKIRAGKRRRQK